MSLTTFPMGLTVNELSSGKCFWLISPEISETFWGSTSEHLTWINLEQKLSSILMKLLIWNISAQVNYTLAIPNKTFEWLQLNRVFFKLDFASCIPVIRAHKTLALYFSINTKQVPVILFLELVKIKKNGKDVLLTVATRWWKCYVFSEIWTGQRVGLTKLQYLVIWGPASSCWSQLLLRVYP